jgi:hypothetical protein
MVMNELLEEEKTFPTLGFFYMLDLMVDLS